MKDLHDTINGSRQRGNPEASWVQVTQTNSLSLSSQYVIRCLHAVISPINKAPNDLHLYLSVTDESLKMCGLIKK